ncbi:MAG TPA: sugar transferase, partial [Acidimicrobiales bacterium]|nr:sugar transferase [Acidimicrobiales bacterium]
MRRLARPLMYVGILGIVFGCAAYHAWVLQDYSVTGTSRVPWTLAYAATNLLVAYGVGLPDLPRSMRQAFATALVAAGAAAVSVGILQLFLGDALLPRFTVFGSALLLVPWYVLTAGLANRFRSRAEGHDRIIVVAVRSDLMELESELEEFPEKPALIVGSLLPDEASASSTGGKPLIELVVAERATVVVLDRSAQSDESVVSQAAQLHEAGLRIRTLSLFYEQWLAKLPVTELERVSLMFDIGEVHRLRYSRLSRMLDLVLASLGLVPLLLSVPFVAVVNLFANRGPLLFRQERVGRLGHTFRILKYRTMTADSSVPAGTWTSEDDPRITRFGGLMRRSHLDELPQVLNILRGDLSIVGPRPEQPRYVAELTRKLPFYDVRHLVRPGLTGWAQVKYGYAGDE